MALIRASFVEACWNYNCQLPYGLTTDPIRLAVEDVYNFFYRINSLLVEQEGLDFFESLVLGNTLSGMMSELLVKRISAHSTTVARNILVGGHPDLIPYGIYRGDSTLRGVEGIEVKTSRQDGGWQGHNPEVGWLMVFRYKMGDQSQPFEERQPIQFVQILAAPLEFEDWSLAERGAESRRTRTTSINRRGMHKLRSNPVYQDPSFIVAADRSLWEQYAALNQTFTKT
ncbi:MAG: hypothetical protein ACRERE_10860 [Candidatus Entotheonellia bacterium]